MGDFIIDLYMNPHKKWQNLKQLFDLSQFISEHNHVIKTSSTIFDHVHVSNPDNIIDCFVPISDHFPGGFTRGLND